MKKPALGKGLDAILGGGVRSPQEPPRPQVAQSPSPAPSSSKEAVRTPHEAPSDPDAAGAGEVTELRPTSFRRGRSGEPLFVDISRVSAGSGQPRRKFDDGALDELANSIKEKGILQPLVVTESASGYELIAGERRLRAATRVGLEKVPIIIKADVDSSELVELALIENIQREDLTPLEEAKAYQRLMDVHDFTQEEVARRVGKSRAAVANTVRLLALPDPVRDLLEKATITEGHARALLALPTAASQITTAKTVVARALSVRATEELVRAVASANGKTKKRAKNSSDPAFDAIEQDLRRSLGTQVKLRRTGKRGRIEIDFYSDDELNKLIEKLAG